MKLPFRFQVSSEFWWGTGGRGTIIIKSCMLECNSKWSCCIIYFPVSISPSPPYQSLNLSKVLFVLEQKQPTTPPLRESGDPHHPSLFKTVFKSIKQPSSKGKFSAEATDLLAFVGVLSGWYSTLDPSHRRANHFCENKIKRVPRTGWRSNFLPCHWLLSLPFWKHQKKKWPYHLTQSEYFILKSGKMISSANHKKGSFLAFTAFMHAGMRWSLQFHFNFLPFSSV